MNPIISIIIPIYNTGDYLHRSLKSVENQTYRNIDVILVDDGSTDNSAQICDEYVAKDARFRVLHKENQGVSKARNDGLRIARGEYIGFVDSDDLIEPDMYEILYNNLVKYDADISICGTTEIKEEREKTYTNLRSLTVFDRDEAVEKLLLGRAFTGSPCDRIFKKTSVENIYFPEDITNGEDGVFVLEAILNSKRVVVDPEPKYKYCKREGSASTSAFSEKMFTYHIANERMIKIISKTDNYHLFDVAHTAKMIADNWLLQKLCADGKKESNYSELLQKSIRESFKLKRLEGTTLSQKISIVACCLNFNLYILINNLRVNIKRFLKKE